jgi:hypothetical protein
MSDTQKEILTPAERSYEAHKKAARLYYVRNKEAISLRLKGWYLLNKETQKKYKQEYYKKTQEGKKNKKKNDNLMITNSSNLNK